MIFISVRSNLKNKLFSFIYNFTARSKAYRQWESVSLKTTEMRYENIDNPDIDIAGIWEDIYEDIDNPDIDIAGIWEDIYEDIDNPDIDIADIKEDIHEDINIKHSYIQTTTPYNEEKPQILAPPPIAPTDELWNALQNSINISRNNINDAKFDIIIPVYKGYNETLNCIYTALNSNNITAFELIVINDYSPDNNLTLKLQELSNKNLFTYIENKQNLGFVQTVNIGMKLHSNRDIILLNSDTECYNNWADRLYDAAHRQNNIATATPFSNNAEICSYPHFVQDNEMELEITFAELDNIAKIVNKEQFIEIPTGVGFCMFIKRQALNELGYFDAEKFGKGYGEENYFCLQAFNKGWRNILATDIFIRHLGGTSFTKDKQRLTKNAAKIIAKTYPDYAQNINNFIINDPIKIFRRNIDLARLKRKMQDFNILNIALNRGGGTEKYLQELSDKLSAENVENFILRQSKTNKLIIELSNLYINNIPNLEFSISYNKQELINIIAELNIKHIHINHLIDYPLYILDFLYELSAKLNLKYDITIHDFYYFCPNVHLLNEKQKYCGEPSIDICEKCIIKTNINTLGKSVWKWRDDFTEFLGGARKIFVPSNDTLKKIQKHFPKINHVFREHPYIFDGKKITPNEGILRIAFMGLIGKNKGIYIIDAMINDAIARNLPIEFVMIGYTYHEDFEKNRNKFTITGKFKDSELTKLLNEYKPNAIFITTIVPETYSYTLSHAFKHQITPIAFNIGAQAERIKSTKNGVVLPLELADNASALNDKILALNLTNNGKKPNNIIYTNMMRDYYNL